MGLHKGQTNNPNGRPRVSLAPVIREYLEANKGDKTRIQILFDILFEEAETEHNMHAIKMLIEQAYGTPAQTVESNVKIGKFDEMGEEQMKIEYERLKCLIENSSK